jgi:predicted ATP-binding protein involved in virulence
MSVPEIIEKIRFNRVVGVGDIELDLEKTQAVYCFIGRNGVGKTKLLEAVFQWLFINSDVAETEWKRFSHTVPLVFLSVSFSDIKTRPHEIAFQPNFVFRGNFSAKDDRVNLPFVYLGALHRGQIQSSSRTEQRIGTFETRRNKYIQSLVASMNNNFSSINMDSSVEEWFTTRMFSSNAFQKAEDNRELEVKLVLKLLHEIDDNIDSEFAAMSGDGRVFIKLNGVERELSHLSSGFSSVVKIIQAIVAGYANFTNERALQTVKGIVLIDEVESHLHNQWQAKILPTLKKLFPNTVFIVTTHSPLVLSQLKHGEAYRLERDEDGVVRNHLINHPNKVVFAELLNDGFGVDLNQLKLLQETSAQELLSEKSALLKLLRASLDGGEK